MKQFCFLVIFLVASAANAEPLLSIHSSNGNFQPIPPFQEPIKCSQARENMSNTLGKVRTWFKPVLYGTVEERILLSNVAIQVHDALLSKGMRETDAGRQKYRNNRVATQTNNGDELCYQHIEKWRKEIERILVLIENEGKMGNRALQGIGIENIL